MSNFYLTKNQVHENTEFWVENTEEDYCAMVRRIIMSKPFGDNKFYIFQFIKRVNDWTGEKKMYHQPRLTKPEPLPGTTLLRVDPRDPDTVTIIWTLPHEEAFNLYDAGKMFSDPFVYECIQKYRKNPKELMKREDGDLSDREIQEVYKSKRRKSNASHA